MKHSIKIKQLIRSTRRARVFFFLLVFALLFSSCKKDKDDEPAETWNPTSYELLIPDGFPSMVIPQDNPLTLEGVALGRKLFYDPILSADNTLACADCHMQQHSFSDTRAFSIGIDGLEGRRNAMPLMNAGWLRSLNWHGSASSLEEQAFEPLTNPLEMHNTWEQAVNSLKAEADYPDLFFAAFGTRNFDSTQVVKAIAQFERTLISNNSKWDQYLRGEYQLSASESKGFEIFFTEKGDCFHCHTTILFTDNEFHNNGLDSVFTDKGLYEVTADPADVGRFKTPSLRNLVFTAPYMHDGRFENLEEVIDFYSEGLKFSPTIDPLMKKVDEGGIQLNQEDKLNLLAFLKTLTDTSFVLNPEFSEP